MMPFPFPLLGTSNDGANVVLDDTPFPLDMLDPPEDEPPFPTMSRLPRFVE